LQVDEHCIRETAKKMRRSMLDMAFECGSNAHLVAGLSMVEVLATLYGAVLNCDAENPNDPDRDRFILSKGHGVLGYYAVLAQAGFFFDRFAQDVVSAERNRPRCSPRDESEVGNRVVERQLGAGPLDGGGHCASCEITGESF
jgi:transketolase N-terminal domain/subunit